eukprot:3665695-Pyramimonas_sp.AAC.1
MDHLQNAVVHCPTKSRILPVRVSPAEQVLKHAEALVGFYQCFLIGEVCNLLCIKRPGMFVET